MRYDVLVVGGGHAGVEAALASARLGARTLMLTLSRAGIATMPCNPAIGGPAKGHLVREIDALGGEMGRAADATALQIKVLNGSKGPAVQALRAQSDKDAYSAYMRAVLDATPNLTIHEGEAIDLTPVREGGPAPSPAPAARDGLRPAVWLVETAAGDRFEAASVVLTTGTFLNGLCHTGERRTPAGRFGEPAAGRLSEALRRLGLTLHRLKTGTPPRVSQESIDFSALEPAPGDDAPLAFSFDTAAAPGPGLPCYLTATTPETHRIILENLHRSPIYGGAIESVGPRYCPSIEDKVVRFKDKESHPVFVEPETARQDVWYIQGLSTSMPEDVQLAFLRTLPGLERAEVVRYGYAVEYDCIPATQLTAHLESKAAPGLFTAGQLNGTSGYEEAAAQGLVAGVNAARRALGKPMVTLPRHESYIGVLIDDLVTKEIRDPYRMLTSRAEYRLILRQDNADLRLTPVGHAWGLASDAGLARVEAKRRAVAEWLAWLAATPLPQGSEAARRLFEATGERIDRAVSALEVLRRPAVTLAHVAGALGRDVRELPAAAAEQVAIQAKYDGYIRRQADQIARQAALEETPIPERFDYFALRGLSREAQDKLTAIRPRSVGQAGRVGGVTPADVSVLLVALTAARRGETA